MRCFVPSWKRTSSEATKGVDLGGALRPNSSHLDFAIRKLEFVRYQSGCLCALYEMDDMYNPSQEEADGHIRILSENLTDRVINCECSYCALTFRVEEQDYHYSWWKWRRAWSGRVDDKVPSSCNSGRAAQLNR